MTAADETADQTMIAMVVLPSTEIGLSEAIVEAFRRRLGATEAVEDLALVSGILIFKMGTIGAMVAKMGFPVPWDDLEGPSRTSWWWENADHDLRSHVDHIVVSITDDGSDKLDTALQLTHLVAAVLETTPAIGVYWGSGTLVMQKDWFLDLAREASREAPPIMLWVDARVVPNRDDSWTVFTTGLEAFGLMEIESENARGEAKEIWALVQDIGAYLLAQGPVIKDGDTVGPDETNKIRVRFARSIFPERKGQVYRLEFE